MNICWERHVALPCQMLWTDNRMDLIVRSLFLRHVYSTMRSSIDSARNRASPFSFCIGRARDDDDRLYSSSTPECLPSMTRRYASRRQQRYSSSRGNGADQSETEKYDNDSIQFRIRVQSMWYWLSHAAEPFLNSRSKCKWLKLYRRRSRPSVDLLSVISNDVVSIRKEQSSDSEVNDTLE